MRKFRIEFKVISSQQTETTTAILTVLTLITRIQSWLWNCCPNNQRVKKVLSPLEDQQLFLLFITVVSGKPLDTLTQLQVNPFFGWKRWHKARLKLWLIHSLIRQFVLFDTGFDDFSFFGLHVYVVMITSPQSQACYIKAIQSHPLTSLWLVLMDVGSQVKSILSVVYLSIYKSQLLLF